CLDEPAVPARVLLFPISLQLCCSSLAEACDRRYSGLPNYDRQPGQLWSVLPLSLARPFKRALSPYALVLGSSKRQHAPGASPNRAWRNIPISLIRQNVKSPVLDTLRL